MKATTRRLVSLTSALALAFVARSALATEAEDDDRDPTKTEEIAECVENAAESYAECAEDSPWYIVALCSAKYAADAILCIPNTLVKDASNIVH